MSHFASKPHWVCLILCLSLILTLGAPLVSAAEEDEATTQPTATEPNQPAQPEQPEQPEQPAQPEQPEQPEQPDPLNGTTLPANLPTDGKIHVFVNGKEVAFDQKTGFPTIKDGRTLLPLRQVGNAMSAAVAWRKIDKTVHLFRDGKSLMLTIGKPEMLACSFVFESKFLYTSQPVQSLIDPDQPQVIAFVEPGVNRTMIPIRAVAEAFGARVGWHGESRSVLIEIPAYTVSLADNDASDMIENWNYTPPFAEGVNSTPVPAPTPDPTPTPTPDPAPAPDPTPAPDNGEAGTASGDSTNEEANTQTNPEANTDTPAESDAPAA